MNHNHHMIESLVCSAFRTISIFVHFVLSVLRMLCAFHLPPCVVRFLQCAAPARSLGDSSTTRSTRQRPRRPPLRSFASCGSVRYHLRSHVTTQTSKAPRSSPFPLLTSLHSCAGLAIRHGRDSDPRGPTYDVSCLAEAFYGIGVLDLLTLFQSMDRFGGYRGTVRGPIRNVCIPPIHGVLRPVVASPRVYLHPHTVGHDITGHGHPHHPGSHHDTGTYRAETVRYLSQSGEIERKGCRSQV
ncbi:hypothetical protein EDB87DRAFT_1015318 [Lactarius vividus]|nr:hypothetical protein EDB87DRAFT_1015318 [Lactarius vividus]